MAVIQTGAAGSATTKTCVTFTAKGIETALTLPTAAKDGSVEIRLQVLPPGSNVQAQLWMQCVVRFAGERLNTPYLVEDPTVETQAGCDEYGAWGPTFGKSR